MCAASLWMDAVKPIGAVEFPASDGRVPCFNERNSLLWREESLLRKSSEFCWKSLEMPFELIPETAESAPIPKESLLNSLPAGNSRIKTEPAYEDRSNRLKCIESEKRGTKIQASRHRRYSRCPVEPAAMPRSSAWRRSIFGISPHRRQWTSAFPGNPERYRLGPRDCDRRAT